MMYPDDTKKLTLKDKIANSFQKITDKLGNLILNSVELKQTKQKTLLFQQQINHYLQIINHQHENEAIYDAQPVLVALFTDYISLSEEEFAIITAGLDRCGYQEYVQELINDLVEPEAGFEQQSEHEKSQSFTSFLTEVDNDLSVEESRQENNLQELNGDYSLFQALWVAFFIEYPEVFNTKCAQAMEDQVVKSKLLFCHDVAQVKCLTMQWQMQAEQMRQLPVPVVFPSVELDFKQWYQQQYPGKYETSHRLDTETAFKIFRVVVDYLSVEKDGFDNRAKKLLQVLNEEDNVLNGWEVIGKQHNNNLIENPRVSLIQHYLKDKTTGEITKKILTENIRVAKDLSRQRDIDKKTLPRRVQISEEQQFQTSYQHRFPHVNDVKHFKQHRADYLTDKWVREYLGNGQDATYPDRVKVIEDLNENGKISVTFKHVHQIQRWLQDQDTKKVTKQCLKNLTREQLSKINNEIATIIAAEIEVPMSKNCLSKLVHARFFAAKSFDAMMAITQSNKDDDLLCKEMNTLLGRYPQSAPNMKKLIYSSARHRHRLLHQRLTQQLLGLNDQQNMPAACELNYLVIADLLDDGQMKKSTGGQLQAQNYILLHEKNSVTADTSTPIIFESSPLDSAVAIKIKQLDFYGLIDLLTPYFTDPAAVKKVHDELNQDWNSMQRSLVVLTNQLKNAVNRYNECLATYRQSKESGSYSDAQQNKLNQLQEEVDRCNGLFKDKINNYCCALLTPVLDDLAKRKDGLLERLLEQFNRKLDICFDQDFKASQPEVEVAEIRLAVFKQQLALKVEQQNENTEGSNVKLEALN